MLASFDILHRSVLLGWLGICHWVLEIDLCKACTTGPYHVEKLAIHDHYKHWQHQITKKNAWYKPENKCHWYALFGLRYSFQPSLEWDIRWGREFIFHEKIPDREINSTTKKWVKSESSSALRITHICPNGTPKVNVWNKNQQSTTPWKINRAPKNGGLEDDFPFPLGDV